jgi:hypothetical protein
VTRLGDLVGLSAVFRFVNEEILLTLESGSGLTLVGVETSVTSEVAWIGGGASYTRPVRVEVGGGESIPIRDHLMVMQLAMAALVVMATVWRIIR